MTNGLLKEFTIKIKKEEMKKVALIFIAVLSINLSFAQGKYGADSVKCVENLSLYRDYLKQKMYDDAYKYWSVAYEICPASSERMYVDGISLVRNKLKNAAKEEKAGVVDELLMVYDKRIENFGKEGYVLGRKGTDMLRYAKDDVEPLYGVLDKSIQLQGSKSEAGAIVSYMNALILMEKDEKVDEAKVVEQFANMTELIAQNISKYDGKKTQEYYIKAQESIESITSPYLSCDVLVEMAEKNYENNKEDQKWMERTADILDQKGCTDATIFFTIAEEMHSTNPSAISAEKMGIMSLKKKQYTEAEAYFKQAIELNQDASKSFNLLMALASSQISKGAYSSARSSARKAMEIEPNNGLPYILIGDMIAGSSSACPNSDACKQKAIYWLAVDYLVKAKAVDPSVSSKANSKIASYSKYFSERDECFFINVKEGDTVQIGCWIGESTKARFN